MRIVVTNSILNFHIGFEAVGSFYTLFLVKLTLEPENFNSFLEGKIKLNNSSLQLQIIINSKLNN